MGEIANLFGINADLEKPMWFYQDVERLSQMVDAEFGEMLEASPLGDVLFDHVYNSIADTPVRLMAWAEGDAELERFIALTGMYRAVMQRMAEHRGKAA